MSDIRSNADLNRREVRTVRKELLAARAAVERRQIVETRHQLAQSLTPAGLFALLRRRGSRKDRGSLSLGTLAGGLFSTKQGASLLSALIAIPGTGFLLGKVFKPLKWAALGWSVWQGVRAGRALRARRVDGTDRSHVGDRM